MIAHVGSMARLRVGVLQAGTTGDGSSPGGLAKGFVDACHAASIEAELTPDIRRALFEKFVFLNALSGLTCLARQPLGVVRSDPELRAAFEASMRETIAVAAMQGDLIGGRRLEAPWLCGRVAALAMQAGIAAPVNATIYAGLKPYLNGAPDSGGKFR